MCTFFGLKYSILLAIYLLYNCLYKIIVENSVESVKKYSYDKLSCFYKTFFAGLLPKLIVELPCPLWYNYYNAQYFLFAGMVTAFCWFCCFFVVNRFNIKRCVFIWFLGLFCGVEYFFIKPKISSILFIIYTLAMYFAYRR